jgi:hypothetical protein
MRKAEIDALVHAHRGRARPVAFFHVLRQPTLEPDDEAFLAEHVDELGASDLLRWRARCPAGLTGAVIQQLARIALEDPAHFQHEVLDVPRLELEDDEWRELADLLRGKVPEAIYARVLDRGGPRPPLPAPTTIFTPGVLDLPGFFLDEELGTPDRASPVPHAGRPVNELSTREILAARRAGELTLDDEALAALVRERARSSSEDWSFAVLDFPDALKDTVLEKARASTRGEERANLLGWLEARGVARAALFPIALEPPRGGQVSYAVVCWLSRQLATRAAWDRHGLSTLSALVAQRAYPEIGELVTVAWSEAGRGGHEPPRGLLEAIQVAFALALCGRTQEALAAGDAPQAMASLSALACLDPPSRISRAVHQLGRAAAAAGAAGEVAELIAVNERLVKHSDARDASLEGVIAALHAIADASA